MTDLLTTPVTTLHDEPTTFAALTGLHRELSDQPFTVVGFPCNQFGEQEPGTAEEIETFCSATYGVSFPMSAKIEVNGPGRDPVYDVLTAASDDKGEAGDVQWNFEKFLVASDGRVLRRFRPMVEPDDDELRTAIETALEA
jgi:glutathione peroxidase